ncbi:hypothetical protein TSAR_012272 [Trichomalopsis sarcophagae]|uniref:C2H2-type domain-containing protein n=1 Tax=Trichomalopsis sarcophagae TaxID=543379 RepID=A0A232FNK1_9HYME|nr:hypothetical protein TSAR_012272 [Trichomalopsis sarcophagae]
MTYPQLRILDNKAIYKAQSQKTVLRDSIVNYRVTTTLIATISKRNCFTQLSQPPDKSHKIVSPPVAGGVDRGHYLCEQCGKSYRWHKNLMAHLRLECNKEPTIFCPFCPTKTKYKKSMRSHMRRMHNVQACDLEQLHQFLGIRDPSSFLKTSIIRSSCKKRSVIMLFLRAVD